MAEGKGRNSALNDLTIKAIGVIDFAELDIGKGFTVLTGETGAGKTMVLTALNFILGGKTDSDFVRIGSDRLSATGTFSISSELAIEIEEMGGVVDDDQLIINRTITSEGKSKISIGGVPSTAAFVSQIASLLIEIHSQSSSQRLSKESIQRELLDSFAQDQNSLQNYSERYFAYTALEKRIKELEKQVNSRESQIVEIETFLKDYKRVSPQNFELEAVENEISKLGSVEIINTNINLALSVLTDSDDSAMSAFANAKKPLEQLSGRDAVLDNLIDSFQDLSSNFVDFAGDLSRYLSKLEADPGRFDYLQNRKSELALLIKKHGSGDDKSAALESIIELAGNAEGQLKDLNGGENRLQELNQELGVLFTELKAAAMALTQVRLASAIIISEKVTGELAALSMPRANFLVSVEQKDAANKSSYSINGLDVVSFLFTSQSEGKLLPLGKSASGGELSRVMLAIEVVLAKSSPVGTYIFDEVDAGVGGKAAIEVGRRLAELAKDAQVIVVTHLAQVAAWADNHFVVEKNEAGLVTQSDVRLVKDEERNREIARLLSGQEESKSAREHAAELIELVGKNRSNK